MLLPESLPHLPLLWLALGLVLALLFDLAFGEPPARWHPVVWMGAYLDALSPHIAPSSGADDAVTGPRSRAFLSGAIAWLVGAGAMLSTGFLLQDILLGLPGWIAVLLLGLMLKPMLAWRMLRDETEAIEAALASSLEAGRQKLSQLVSRDVTQLGPEAVRESAIETLAENLNDSVVAPLFWFALLGLPGALLYRFANTADAMWGYKGHRLGRNWLWAGKWAAHADDALSFVPARLTAAAIFMVARCRHWQLLAQEARRTPSPNGGWPMGAMALALGKRLGKPGAYTLNPQAAAPEPIDVARAIGFAGRAVFISLAALCVPLLLGALGA